MEGILVMILINTKKISSVIIFFSLFYVYSCETLNEIAGITKPDMDDTLISETPELILPPDFDKEPRRRLSNSQEIDRQTLGNQFQQPFYPTVVPRITNYYSPEINVRSSPSPSDSLERFKQNKKFTIGEWVYSQYVDGFKRGNLYYQPVYDKGYNFSRRYMPDRNVASFQTPQLMNKEQIDQGIENNLTNRSEEYNFESLDQLPIID